MGLRLLGRDQGRARLEVIGIDQRLGRRIGHVAAVGHVGVQIGKGHLDRLDLQVQRHRIIGAHVTDASMAEHLERHQRGDALTVGRDLVQVQVVEAAGQRAAPFGAMRGEVLFGQHGAMGAGVIRNLLGDGPLVESAAARLRNRRKRIGHVMAPEPFARPGRAPTGHEGLGKARLVGQDLRAALPQRSDHRRHGKTIGRVADGGRQYRGQIEFAEPVDQFGPGGDRARHRHAFPAAERDLVLPGEALGRPAHRGRARGIEAVQFLAVPQDAVPVRAQPVARGLDHGQGRGGGDGGIDGIAALGEHRQARLRRQGMRGGNHVLGQNGRTAGSIKGVMAQCHHKASFAD